MLVRNKGAISRYVQYLPSLETLCTPFLVAASQTTLTIKGNTHIKVINGAKHSISRFDANTTFAVADYLDTGVIQAGKDYYVYALDFVPTGKTLALLVSLNSTFPTGATADNSRKIGGFHTLCLAVGAIGGHILTGFATAAILPASVWCLNFQPRCNPEGMVYSDQAKLWVDIYLVSGTGINTASAFGAVITQVRNWFNFADDLAAVGKRHLDDAEFAMAAAGSNEGTNIVGSADPVTTGGHSDTAGRRMISHIGMEDVCGAIWQWLRDNAAGGIKLLAGGYYGGGAVCGRWVRISDAPALTADTGIGARGCADPM